MAAVDFSALSGDFKEAYAAKIADNVPDANIVTRMTDFQKGEKLLGNLFHIPVKVKCNVGATYNNDGSAFTILSAIPMQLADAQIRGSEILIPAPISYGAVTRSAGKNAFGRAVDLTVDDLRKSIRKRVELGLLYGQLGIGQSNAGTADSATQETLTISDATWAAGIWAGLTGVELNFYNAGSLVSSGADAIFTLASVSMANKTITVTGTATGCTALHTARASADAYFRGSKLVEMVGLQTIASNVTTLFNINAATYEQWQGNTFTAASAQLTFEKLQDAASLAVARGCEEEMTALVAVKTFAKLNTELAGARVFDSSYSKSKAENGVEAIEFYGANGKIKVVAHPYMKEGIALLLPMSHIYRIGSTEPTFQPVPGTDEVFHQSTTAGVEVRVYTDQAVISDAPSYCVLINNIVN